MTRPAKPRRFAGYGSVQAEQAREEGRKKRAREAQEAFERGQDELLAGRIEAGYFWLSRSERLTRGCSTATLATATAALALGKLEDALPRLQKLREQYDLPEAAYGEILCLERMGRFSEAAQAMQLALNHLPVPDSTHTPFLANQLARVAACPGWATLSNSSTLLLRSAEPAEVTLDGVFLGKLSPGKHVLDGQGENAFSRWREGEALSLQIGGKDVLGSPFDLVKLTRSDSLVVPTQEGLAGWLWHPSEPSFQPKLFLENAPGPSLGQDTERRALEGVVGRQENESVSFFPATQRALAKPWFFRIKRDNIPFEGLVKLRDTHGRLLKGTPVAPLLGKLGVSDLGPKLLTPKETFKRSKNLQDSHLPGCSVIIPIHNGSQVTQECLRSVLASVTPEEAELVVVDDASTEIGLGQWLTSLAATGRITLLRNTENQGFVQSVNRGLRYVVGQQGAQRDVVLLNSDTTVFAGWLKRLRSWLQQPNVGTVTPFSNEGGQLSWPSVKTDNALPSVEEARRIDQLCAEILSPAVSGPPHSLVTGNGFCMGISAACLAQTGLLREDVFAQGYGEENDFCCRATALGFVHLTALNVFVRHIGSVSFGPGRWGLLARNVRFVEALHPGYLKRVKAFEQQDPLSAARRTLSEAWLKDLSGRLGQGSVLLVQHEAGGGVARAVRERGAVLENEGKIALTLTPIAQGCRLALVEGSRHSLQPVLDYSLPQEGRHLVTLLKALQVEALEWHHLIGHASWVRQLHEQLDVPYDVYVHDHVWFCPRIALLSPEGRYCGEPDLEGCLACVARGGEVLGEEISIPDLRARSAHELGQARRIVDPSWDAARRLQRRFPACGPIEVQPLQEDTVLYQGRSLPRARDGNSTHKQNSLRVGVVGGLCEWKGSDLLLDLARYVQAQNLPLELVLIGTAENEGALIEAGVEVTGEYQEKDALNLVKNAQLHLGFLPSLAPETWCYALEWLWRAGLGVTCFDIGAMPERIRALEAKLAINSKEVRPENYILPLNLPVERIASFFLTLQSA